MLGTCKERKLRRTLSQRLRSSVSMSCIVPPPPCAASRPPPLPACTASCWCLACRQSSSGNTSSRGGSRMVGEASGPPPSGRCTTQCSGCFCAWEPAGERNVCHRRWSRGPICHGTVTPARQMPPKRMCSSSAHMASTHPQPTCSSAVYSFSMRSIRCSIHSSASCSRPLRLLACRACGDPGA